MTGSRVEGRTGLENGGWKGRAMYGCRANNTTGTFRARDSYNYKGHKYRGF